MAVTKLLGALLLVSACAALGLERSLELRRRVRNLSALLDALALMRTKICRLLTPLPEMAEDLGREAPEPVRPLFLSLRKELPRLGERPFSELWAGAVEASRGDCCCAGKRAEPFAPWASSWAAAPPNRRGLSSAHPRVWSSACSRRGRKRRAAAACTRTGTRVRPSAERGAAVSSVRRFRHSERPRALPPAGSPTN
jgi:hypothetical protein